MDNLFCASSSMYEDEPLLSNIKRIIIPDGVTWYENDMFNFDSLETVSLSARDYWKTEDINNKSIQWQYTVRLPVKEEFMHTPKTDSMLEFLYKKCGKKKLHDRFAVMLAIEYVNHSWTEDQALLLMASVAIESEAIHDMSELNTWIDSDYKDYLSQLNGDMTIYQKAKFITNNSVLKTVYAIRGLVDEKLGITANNDLYEVIKAVQKVENADFKLTLNDTISIGNNCLLGFDGTGSLKGTKYYITGESTSEINKHIIRLTSEYQLQGKAARHFSTPYLLKLNFFGQHWFEKDAQMGRLWSYPNGEIYNEGFVDTDVTVEDILTDLACIGSQFKGVKMMVYFHCKDCRNRENQHIPYKNNILVFTLKHGEVSIGWTDYHYISRDNYRNVMDEYCDKQFKCEDLLDDEYIDHLNHRNTYDMFSDYGKQEAEHIAALKPYDDYVLFILEMYMKEKYGWSFHFNNTATKKNYTDISLGYQLLRLLFHNYNVDEIVQKAKECYAN